jgi:CTP:molybdopterin cytidylyltransferase MocA
VITGLLLAAGEGRRYGMPKALARVDGEALVERGLRVLRDGGLPRVTVVLGAAAEQVRATCDLGDAEVAVNADWPTGMGSSLRCGLAALSDVDAVLVLLVDTPGITPEAVRRVAAFAAPDALAAATYGGQQGHPVLLGREHWAGVAEAAVGDRGARAYLRMRADLRLVPCDDIADGTDLDAPPAQAA